MPQTAAKIPPTMGALDGAQSAREGGSDGGEDQQGHTVTDATLGNLLTHPHDDGGTCTQGDDNQQDVQYVVLGDDAGAVTQQTPERAIEMMVVAFSRARAMVR